jgi:hypothetical protein
MPRYGSVKSAIGSVDEVEKKGTCICSIDIGETELHGDGILWGTTKGQKTGERTATSFDTPSVVWPLIQERQSAMIACAE